MGEIAVTNLISSYGCFQKEWYPQIIHFNRVFHYKPSILGYPYFWKHPYGFCKCQHFFTGPKGCRDPNSFGSGSPRGGDFLFSLGVAKLRSGMAFSDGSWFGISYQKVDHVLKMSSFLTLNLWILESDVRLKTSCFPWWSRPEKWDLNAVWLPKGRWVDVCFKGGSGGRLETEALVGCFWLWHYWCW